MVKKIERRRERTPLWSARDDVGVEPTGFEPMTPRLAKPLLYL